MNKELITEIQAHLERLRKIRSEERTMIILGTFMNTMIILLSTADKIGIFAFALGLHLMTFCFCIHGINRERRKIIARVEEIAENEISGDCDKSQKVTMLVEKIVKELKTK